MTAHDVIEIEIDRPSAEVFDVIHDYDRRLEWDTLLRKAYTEHGEPAGKDVVAICAARWHLGGLVFATRYVRFARPSLAAVTLVHPYLMFDMWSASIRHKELSSGGTGQDRSLVTYTLTFRCRPAWLARPMEAVAQRLFRQETRRRLRALKRYVESSEQLTGRRRQGEAVGS